MLTLALSISCRTSVLLDGFKYPGTDVSCPKYWWWDRSIYQNVNYFKCLPPPCLLTTYFDFFLNIVIQQDVRVDAVIRLRQWEGVEGSAFCGFLLGLLVPPLFSFQEDALERRHETGLLKNRQWKLRLCEEATVTKLHFYIYLQRRKSSYIQL